MRFTKVISYWLFDATGHIDILAFATAFTILMTAAFAALLLVGWLV